MWKQGSTDPKGFAKGQVLDAIIGALIVPVLGLILFLGLLFILSYTHLLGGPYGIARFFFWLLLIVYTIGGLVIYSIYSAIRNAVTNAKERTKKFSDASDQSLGIRDAEVINK